MAWVVLVVPFVIGYWQKVLSDIGFGQILNIGYRLNLTDMPSLLNVSLLQMWPKPGAVRLHESDAPHIIISIQQVVTKNCWVIFLRPAGC